MYGSVHISEAINKGHHLCNPGSGLAMWLLALPDQNRGNVFRDLRKRNDGTLTNMGASITSGWNGPRGRWGGYGSLAFDGTDDRLPTTLATAPSGGLTACLWSRTTATGANYSFINQYRNTAASTLQFFTFGSAVFARIHQTVDTVYIGRTAPEPTSGAWHHIAMTWDGGTTNAAVKIYLDGIQADTANSSAGSFTAAGASTQVWRVGFQQNASPAAHYSGSIDNVMVYLNRCLTAIDIQELYHDSLAGHPGMLNWYRSQRGYAPATGNRRRRIIIGGAAS